MQTLIQQVEQQLLTPADISEQQLAQVFDQLLSQQIDAADLYFQSSQSESWTLEDGIIKNAHFDHQQGVGIRALSGETTGFAYADEISLPSLLTAARAASSIANYGNTTSIQAWRRGTDHSCYLPVNSLTSLNEAAKIDFLQRCDVIARAQDPRVKQVIASISAEYDHIFIVNANAEMSADIRPLVRCNVTVIVEDNQGQRETGSAGGGGRYDYSLLLQQDMAEKYSKQAVQQALINLSAIDAPAGIMPVVLGPGWPGVLLHEAVGHGLEADFNRKGTSAFSDRIGEKVASPLCTVVDDGTLAQRRGSIGIDDEGTPSQCTTLIEKGILKGYMHDQLSARLMKKQATGNGRRESYAHLTMPRMTNTYMLAGPHHPSEIIASVKKGIYAVNFAGGQVDITSGQFVFSANQAYLIENGKLGAALKGVTLIGNGPEVLTKVSMVGNDLRLDDGVGVCGKNGQSVPVGVGQPTLKIDQLTVGGAA